MATAKKKVAKKKAPAMNDIEKVQTALDKHEAECLIRAESFESRLSRLEKATAGLYPFIAACVLIAAFIK